MTRMLSRRDRAAVVLALECLRLHVLADEAGDALDSAEAALGLPWWAPADRKPNDALQAIRRTRAGLPCGDVIPDIYVPAPSPRLLRARLALYLRALLRADANDLGTTGMICKLCGAVRGREHCLCCSSRTGSPMCSCWGAWRMGRIPTHPLWNIPPTPSQGEDKTGERR